MRVLVVTVVHDPRDARIRARQIPALLAAGHDVTFAAPFSDTGVPSSSLPCRALDLPRAVGRRRGAALRRARRVVTTEGPRHDLVLLHDPELLLTAVGARTPIVWDVHEDAASAIRDRSYLPRPLRAGASQGLRRLERWAERRLHLILAEDGYAMRFSRSHPVVPNVPVVPDRPPAVAPQPRAVYLGRVARARGLDEIVAVARRAPAVTVDVVGWADPELGAWDDDAPSNLRWSGPVHVANDVALARLPGASAGLSLLHDQPNYRASLPTKILEYMAHSVPVVTTPLPRARRLVEAAGCGHVVGFEAVDEAVEAVTRLVDDPGAARRMGERGWRFVREHHDWNREGPRFVRLLEGWARQ